MHIPHARPSSMHDPHAAADIVAAAASIAAHSQKVPQPVEAFSISTSSLATGSITQDSLWASQSGSKTRLLADPLQEEAIAEAMVPQSRRRCLDCSCCSWPGG
jgi:hypothetical protein